LAEQIKFLAELDLDFSVETTGFEIGEIDVMIEGLNPFDERASEDILPEENDRIPVSKIGDLWSLNRHRVLCGNSLNESSFELLMQNRKAPMVFVDPPYNVPIERHASGLGKVRHRDFAMAVGEMSKGEFTDFLAQAFRRLVQYSIPGSIHYACSDWRHIQEPLDAAHQVYSELKNVCVWVKDNAGMGSFYRSQHEFIFVFKAGGDSHRNNFQLGQFGRYRTNVWNYPGANSFSRNTEEGNLLELHPTVKPVALVADAIMDVSARGDIVLDCFLGRGNHTHCGRGNGSNLLRHGIGSAIRRHDRPSGGKNSQVCLPPTLTLAEVLTSWRKKPQMQSNSEHLNGDSENSATEQEKELSPTSERVGFCRPPRATRFKKGVSGNPNGRPKGSLNVATTFIKALREKVVINEGGKRKTVTKLEAALKQLVNKAASGDLHALRQLRELANDAEAKQNAAAAGEH
jgi:DNA modification methylase